MLKDITLGQFFPGNSIVHRIDPRFKLILTGLFIAIVFCAKTVAGYALVLGLLLFIVLNSRISPRLIFKSLKAIVVFVVFTAVLNLFFTSSETPWFQWRFITIGPEGVIFAVKMVLRIVFLITGTSMLTYTTSPIMLTDAIEQLFSPLKKLKLPIHELAMMMSIALRFIPTLIEETDKIMSAQRSRGADFDSGNLIRRARSLIPLLIPLFVSAFRRADELATAMESRCYRGGEGRSKYKVMKSAPRDYIALGLFVLVLAAVIVLGYFGIGRFGI
ncbi:MAG: energy-coupling factor transporter transmembrane protein EcfT [Ruminococcaceae bacterium]|nr:energy-coupling factor transporter transmembrane protein EcfT [Oscillospiraceae bacterium]